MRTALLARGMVSLCLSMTLALGGCASRPTPTPVPVPKERAGMVQDLYQLPQDLLAYVGKDGQRRLISDLEQSKQNALFDRLYFRPWTVTKSSIPAKDAFAVFGGQSNLSKPRGWAENLLPWTPERWAQLTANASRDTFPSRLDKAITVHPTVLRDAPTNSPRFANPKRAGEGYPFDWFMLANLPAGMPLLIVHTSADNAWCYVENALVGGWVPSKDLALVDEVFQQTYQQRTQAAMLRDNVPLCTPDGRYVTSGHIGTLLPVESVTSATLRLLVPVKNTQGRAELVSVMVSASDAACKPLPLTPEHVARLGNVMMGQPYGWGGYLGNRDCSLALRDLFVPFGVWLPRNSASQAKAWNYRSLAEETPSVKERMIAQEGVPFATLIWLRGHIALYIGTYQGKPVMFHNMWGIRTEEHGKEGRYVLGRAVITSLSPGSELRTVEPERLILPRIQGISRLE